MKQKNRIKYLTAKQAWWDKLPKDVQSLQLDQDQLKHHDSIIFDNCRTYL